MGLSLYRRHFIALALLAQVAGLSSAQAKSTPPHLPAATILVLGDSLSAEYGLKRGSGWVALLEQRLVQEKIAATVVNASISGDTTSGGRSRLPALLAQHRPTLVVIELGGNDALRGLPLAMTQDNLTAMTQAAQATRAKVLLLGMQVPPNYGQDYAAKFADTFATVAQTRKAALVPFLLKGIADGPDATRLFQADRIHPVGAAHPTILNTVWPTLKKLIA
ncbi:MAG: arylesterase [Rhodoferax sp.]|nr:arylesterase [Rhodoferax sp.]MDP3654000.1 arylesterase [Rhodoferax sp.]